MTWIVDAKHNNEWKTPYPIYEHNEDLSNLLAQIAVSESVDDISELHITWKD